MKKVIDVKLQSLVFIICLLLFDFLLKFYAKIPMFALKSIAFTVSFACGLLIFSYFFKIKTAKRIQVFFVFLAFILTFTNAIHFRFFNTFFTFTSLQAVGEAKDFSNEVLAVLDPKYLLLFVPILSLVYFNLKTEINDFKLKHVLLTHFVVLLISYMTPFAFFDQDESISNDEFYLYDHLQNRVLSVQRFGFYTYTKQDLMNTLFAKRRDDVTIDEIDQYFEKYLKSVEDNYVTGVFEGKNLILIQAESLGINTIDPIITPTLYHMQNNGLSFENFYAPLYNGSTSDTEFVTLTGQLPSLDFGTTFINFYENDFRYSLGKTFLNNGYNVNSYHANHASFYNRENMHPSLGFDLYDSERLGLDVLASDKELFEKYLAQIPSDPFVSLLITVTGHSPYQNRPELEENFLKIRDLEKYENYDDSVIYYLAAQMYFDQALTLLVDDLNEQGLLDDTVIVIYGDHQPKLDINIFRSTLGSGLNNDYELSRVPLIIYNSSVEPQRLDNLMASVDLWPTLANMFGFTKQNAWLFGSDYFSDNISIVLFQNRAYLIDGCLETSEKIADFCDISDEKKSLVNRFVMDSVRIWQGILLYDYFGGE